MSEKGGRFFVCLYAGSFRLKMFCSTHSELNLGVNFVLVLTACNFLSLVSGLVFTCHRHNSKTEHQFKRNIQCDCPDGSFLQSFL